jgi:predicted lysophospholipase L1 biosynthesis ABC-type transport system permease subunit
MAASRAAASSITVAVAVVPLLRLDVVGAAAILRAARGGRWQGSALSG